MLPEKQPPLSFRNLQKKAAELADKLDLDYNEGAYEFMNPRYPSVSGLFRGRRLGLNISVSGGKSSEFLNTYLSLLLDKPQKRWFSIKKASLIHGITKHLNPNDVEVGENKFDRKFSIRAKDDEWMAKMLTQEARQLMHSVWLKRAGIGELELLSQRFQYSEGAGLNSIDRIVDLVHLMDYFADKMNELSFFEGTSTNQEQGEEDDRIF